MRTQRGPAALLGCAVTSDRGRTSNKGERDMKKIIIIVGGIIILSSVYVWPQDKKFVNVVDPADIKKVELLGDTFFEGNVGIGTIHPEGKLQVEVGPVEGFGTVIVGNKKVVGLGTNFTAQLEPGYIVTINGEDRKVVEVKSSTVMVIDEKLSKGATDAKYFITNPKSKTAIFLGGYVGVGTVDPQHRLDIGDGNMLVRGKENFTKNKGEAVVYMGDINHYVKSVRGSGLIMGTYGAEDGIALLENTGNVGIGTNKPAGKIHVQINTKKGTGLVSVQKDSMLVTGKKTEFTKQLEEGDRVTIDSQERIVTKIIDDDSIRIDIEVSSVKPISDSTFTYKKSKAGLFMNGKVGIGTLLPIAPLDIKTPQTAVSLSKKTYGTLDGKYSRAAVGVNLQQALLSTQANDYCIALRIRPLFNDLAENKDNCYGILLEDSDQYVADSALLPEGVTPGNFDARIGLHDNTDGLKLDIYAGDNDAGIGCKTQHGFKILTSGRPRIDIHRDGVVKTDNLSVKANSEKPLIVDDTKGDQIFCAEVNHGKKEINTYIYNKKSTAKTTNYDLNKELRVGERIKIEKLDHKYEQDLTVKPIILTIAGIKNDSIIIPQEMPQVTWQQARVFHNYPFVEVLDPNDKLEFIVDITGNVGIGVDEPKADLHVVSKTALFDHVFIASHTGAGVGMVITKDSKVGIGTMNPNRKLYVKGNSGGTGEWQKDSDKRLKKNITTLTGALDKVKALRGVNYEWKPLQDYPEGQQIGLIAQEVKGVVPEVVSERDDGYYGVAAAGLVPVLIEAIKEQQIHFSFR